MLGLSRGSEGDLHSCPAFCTSEVFGGPGFAVIDDFGLVDYASEDSCLVLALATWVSLGSIVKRKQVLNRDNRVERTLLKCFEIRKIRSRYF